jgi:hypothetical protein
MTMLILSIGSLSLNLTKFEQRDYRKLRTICKVDPTNIGGSKISMAVYPIKYSFNFSANVAKTQKETLDLIIGEHTRRISEKISNPEVLLQDRRNAIVETVTTPSRLLADSTTITTIPNGIKYFPKFKCGVTEYDYRELESTFMCNLSLEEL